MKRNKQKEEAFRHVYNNKAIIPLRATLKNSIIFQTSCL